MPLTTPCRARPAHVLMGHHLDERAGCEILMKANAPDYTALVLRLGLGAMYLSHGLLKFFVLRPSPC